MLDEKLSFSDHVEMVKSKVTKRIGVLGRIRKYINKQTALTLYKTLVLPHFDYCDYVWDHLTFSDAYTLQKLENSAMRMILDADIYTSCHKMHKELGLMWLDERRIYHTADQMYRCMNDLAPPRMQRMFTRLDAVSERATRASTRGDLVEESVKPKV